jgi:hypothetical protein
MTELRKLILEVEDIESELAEVSQWGVKVLMKGMTGKERAKFLRGVTDKDGQANFERFYPDLIIATAYDPDSEEKLFDIADRDALNSKSGAALETLARVAMRLSGLERGQVEEIEADLKETATEDST